MLPQKQLIAAAGDIGQALDVFAAAHRRYRDVFRTVSRAAHPSANRQLMLETTIGIEPLNSLIVRRLRALGLQSVLDQARTIGMVDDLVGELSSKISMHVR